MDTVNKNCDRGLQLMPDTSERDEKNSSCLISSEGNAISGNDVVCGGCHAINDHLNRSGKGKRSLPSSFQLHANTSSRKIKISYGKPFSSKNHVLTEVNRSIGSEADQDDDNSRSSNAQRILPQSLVASEKNTDAAGNDSSAGEKAVIIYNERAIYEETLKNLSEPKFFANISKELLSVALLFHQKVALAWMIQKEKSTHCAGGILADDQGLGKTISMIALILKQRALQSKFKANNIKPTRQETLNLDDDDEDGNITAVPTSSKWKPAAGTLIVCPGTVLRQWARELDEKVNKRSRLSILIYHGGKRTRDPRHLTKYDVVLTTYPIVTNEVVKFPLDFDGNGEQINLDEDRSRGSSVKERKFCNKKNRKKNANMVNDSYFDSDNGPLGRVRWFRVILDEAQTIKNHQTKVAKACNGLRARSRWCLSGTPVQNSIDDLYSYFRFLRYEPYAAYSSFCKLIRGPISQNASYGCKKLQAVLNTVLLRRTKGTLINQAPIAKLPPKSVYLKKVDFSPEEHLFYKKLEEEARQLVNQYAAAGTTNKNYTSILLMILRLRQACSHPLLVKDYNTDTVVKGSLEMANQLPKDKLSKLLNQLEESQAICHVCNDPPENAIVTICGHVYCYQCVSERLTGDENICLAPSCEEKLSTEFVFSRSTLQKCTSNQDDANHASCKSLLNNADCSLFQSSYVSSKIKAAFEILNNLSTPDSVEGSNEWTESESTVPVKAIVFSQWNGMLNLFEKALNRSHIQYRRLDGSMSLAQRDKSVMEFNSNPKVTVMLMALKAGNLGLNMVAASHVILLDLWWNPSTEDQAIDRAHRIGQTRPVCVTRITIKDTVEDRILALQEEKRRLVSSALGEDKISARARRRLTMKDLKYLFKV